MNIAEITEGMRVQWTVLKSRASGFDMKRMDGVVVTVGERCALVKMRNNHKKWINAEKLSDSKARSALDRFFDKPEEAQP